MKTRVIAFRVTQEQYDALALRLEFCKRPENFHRTPDVRTMSDLVHDTIREDLLVMLDGLAKERKRLDAKAKRDAKKAAVESPVMRNQRIKRERKAGFPDGAQ
jgi:hypothetical protein